MTTTAELTTDEQAKRRYHLGQLRDTHHRPGAGDYADTYKEFYETYFGDGEQQEESLEGCSLIPKYAAVRSDETYGMISVHDNIIDAVKAEGEMVGEEYLSNPAGVYDLDTGKMIETISVTMTKDAYVVICAAVAPETEGINVGGIFSDGWPEAQALFPATSFWEWSEAHPDDGDNDENHYDPNAL